MTGMEKFMAIVLAILVILFIVAGYKDVHALNSKNQEIIQQMK